MSFIATPMQGIETWEYQTDSEYPYPSLSQKRYDYLYALDCLHPIKVALYDKDNDCWTKWENFPGPLFNRQRNEAGYKIPPVVVCPYDVHRSIMPHEVVLESDYPTYEENREAAVLMGKFLEDRGWIPHYYYSGNKSIHVHVFVDFKKLIKANNALQEAVMLDTKGSKAKFLKNFMKWLRTEIITMGGTELRKFDKDLINPKHLIRAELSKHKLGYKTFLSYTYEELPPKPLIRNEENKAKPVVARPLSSMARDVDALLTAYMQTRTKETQVQRATRVNHSLLSWKKKKKGELLDCVKYIMSDAFIHHGDGMKRGAYILCNELRKVYGDDMAEQIMQDWNDRMGNPLRQEDLDFQMKHTVYEHMSCKYIHAFLEDIGASEGKCNN